MKILKFIAKERSSIINLSILQIVIMIFVCGIFSKIYVENIPFGIVDLDNSTLSRTIIEDLKISPGLNVNYYTDSKDELEKAITSKRISGGIIIPKDFNKDVVESKSPTVALIIDGTNIVIGNNLYAYGSSVIGTINAGIQMKIFEGKNMNPFSATKAISSFSYVERILYESQLSYMRYLMYSIIPYLIQGTFLMKFLVPMLIDNRKKFQLSKIKSKEGMKSVLSVAITIIIMMLIATISSFIGLCILDKYFNLPLRGNTIEYFALMLIFLVNITAMGFVFSAFIDNPIYFVQFFCMTNIVTFLTSGVAFPEYVMPNILVKITKMIWPLMNVAMPFKYLNLKGIGWDILSNYLKSGILYGLIWIPIGIGLYSLRIGIFKYKNAKKEAISENNEKSLAS